MNKHLFPKLPDQPKDEACVVVFSGGQDSVTCLGWALKTYKTVYALSFSYGQNHEVELSQAELIAEKLNVPWKAISISAFEELADSALVTGGDVNAAHNRNPDLPASFVPNRNAMFLTIAHAYAQKVGAKNIVMGVCETDFSGYPDCREGFIRYLGGALDMGAEVEIDIHTPLMYLTKAETFAVAEICGVLQLVLRESHTCYKGDRTNVAAWGHGCGECPACMLRAAGFVEYQDELSKQDET